MQQERDWSGTVNTKKIAVVTVLCAVVALAACRREESYEPLKKYYPFLPKPAW